MTAASVLAAPRPEPLRILEGRAAPILRAFADDWRQLAAPTHPFLLPEWFALMGALGAVGTPLVVGARRGERLVAALPLALRGRTLHSLGNAHTPRYDMVGDPAALPLLWRRLCTDRRWDVLELDSVPSGSALATALPELARERGFLVRTQPRERSPHFALAGFEQRLGSKFRGNLRRRARKLAGLSYERIGRYDAAALDEGLALEAKGWKGELGTAVACDPALRRFYHAAARVFARKGQLTLAFLRTEGRRIAFHYAFEDERAYYLLKPGFDPEFSSVGPGQLLVREAAADALARGRVEFDFLGWDMDWKLEWTTEVRPHVRLVVYRPSVRGYLRHAARDVLRPCAGALVRALRQRIRA